MADAPNFRPGRLSLPDVRKHAALERYSLGNDNRPLCDIEEALFLMQRGLTASPIFVYMPYAAALVTPLDPYVVVAIDPASNEITGLAADPEPFVALTAASPEFQQFDDGLGGTVERLAQLAVLFSPFIDLTYVPAAAPPPSRGDFLHYHTTTRVLVKPDNPSASERAVAVALDGLGRIAFTGILTEILAGFSPAVNPPEVVQEDSFRGNVTSRAALEDHVHGFPDADAFICYLNENATKKLAEALLDIEDARSTHAGLGDMPSENADGHDGRYILDKNREPSAFIPDSTTPYQPLKGGAKRVSFDNVPVNLPGAPTNVQDAIAAVKAQLEGSETGVVTVVAPWRMRLYAGIETITSLGHTGLALLATQNPGLWQTDAANKEWVTLSGDGSNPGGRMHSNDPFNPVDFQVPTAPDGSFSQALRFMSFGQELDTAYMYLTFRVQPGAGTVRPTFLFSYEGLDANRVNFWLEKDVDGGGGTYLQITKNTLPFSATELVDDEEDGFLLLSGSGPRSYGLLKWVPPLNDASGSGQTYRLHITMGVPTGSNDSSISVLTNLLAFANIVPINQPV